MQLLLERRKSPLGALLIATDAAQRLCALDFEDCESRFERLLARHHPGSEIQIGTSPERVTDALDAYFAGDIRTLEGLEPVPCGTHFQRAVWAALRRIPAGETRSYGALARELEAPGAGRAVGLANGQNPIALVVPCHRVIGKDGSLTGYAGGLARKRWLLAHEAKGTGTECRSSEE